jgi:helicase
VTLPTSAGKTLIAEFALTFALSPGPGICFYIVPYIALGNQVVQSLLKHVPCEMRVHALFGGFRGSGQLDPGARREIVVATPERFDAILRSLAPYDYTRLVVVDELHLIESGVRGARIEGLISRLLLMQDSGANFRLICLSAVLSKSTALCEWLRVSEDMLFTHPWRPTARRVGIWLQQGSLVWLYGNDPARPEGKADSDVVGWKTLPWPHAMYATDRIGQITSQLSSAYSNTAYLARYLGQDIGTPLLIVCGTRAASRGIAAALSELLLDLPELSTHNQNIVNAIRSQAIYLRSMIPMIRKGVAFHNASIPPRIRGLIEAAIRARSLNYVAATTTLAEGVDLPFRVAILHDWLRGFGNNQRPMGALLFRNIAGRCGRAGEFPEGDTIIFDNVLGSLKYTHLSVRRRWQLSLFSDPPELQSAISNDNFPSDEQRRIHAIIASQYLALVPEHPSCDDLNDLLSGALYRSRAGERQEVLSMMRRIHHELVDTSDGEPFAIAASPMRLTDLGRQANLTGLSPATCRMLLRFFHSEIRETSDSVLCSTLLLALGECPEQQNAHLAAMAAGRRKRFFVSNTDLPFLIEGWFQRTPLHELFLALPKARASKAVVSPTKWISGEASSEFVASQYDKFIDFMEYVIAGFLPWILRSCRILQDFGATWAMSYDWDGLAERIEDSQVMDLTSIDEAIRGTENEPE